MLDILSVSEEYIVPKLNDNLISMKTHFIRDELWYLDHDREVIPLDDGGLEIPDIISCQEMIFISDKLKRFLINNGIDYIFYKEILVSDDVFGIEELFWLISVPRIDCIDFERSTITDKEEYDYNNGIVPFYNIEDPVIISECCGRYEIFRILGSTSNMVYVKGKLYQKLQAENFIGIGFRNIL